MPIFMPSPHDGPDKISEASYGDHSQCRRSARLET